MSNDKTYSDDTQSLEHAEQIDAVTREMSAASEQLQHSAAGLAEVESELRELMAQRERYALLQHAVDAVRRLDDPELTSLFWGEQIGEHRGDVQLRAVEEHISQFSEQVGAVESRRQQAAEVLGERNAELDLLAEDLYDLQQEQETRLHEWVVEREEDRLPRGIQIMPWTRGFEDDRRFRQSLLSTLAVSALLGLIIPFIDLPIPERDDIVEVPERFAKLIERAVQIPLPRQPVPVEPEEFSPPEPEEVVADKPVETKPKVAEVAEPAIAKQESAREKVASKGILAFRESFSNLADSHPSAKLGAKARISSDGQQASRPERNMITTQAMGSSGGINLAAVSRNLGEAGGGDMAGVQTTQIASSIAGTGGVDRPLSAGAIAGRTDEEIQIVFDRYKAALYRMYNRELRKDPTLRGQLILQLTIEPDGSVSLCSLQASDMNAPELADQVMKRVSSFDFGAKDVPAITIAYPIDFLPTA